MVWLEGEWPDAVVAVIVGLRVGVGKAGLPGAGGKMPSIVPVIVGFAVAMTKPCREMIVRARDMRVRGAARAQARAVRPGAVICTGNVSACAMKAAGISTAAMESTAAAVESAAAMEASAAMRAAAATASTMTAAATASTMAATAAAAAVAAATTAARRYRQGSRRDRQQKRCEDNREVLSHRADLMDKAFTLQCSNIRKRCEQTRSAALVIAFSWRMKLYR